MSGAARARHAARKASEEELNRISAEREALLESANVGISLVVDRRQVWVNQWMLDTFQYGREELEGQTTRILYTDQDAYDAMGREAYPVLAAGKVMQTVQHLVRRDGARLWIHYNGRLLFPDDPSKGVIWVLADVTARHLAEMALQESESRFRTLFEAHSAVMLMVDPDDGRILDGNPAAAAFYGYSREQLRSMGIQQINQAEPEEVSDAFHRAGRRDQDAFVFRHRLASGATRIVQVHSSPVAVQGRELLFSIISDITEKATAEAELRASEARFRTLFRLLPAGVTITDDQGRVLETNDANEALLGIPADEIRRRDFQGPSWDVIRPDGSAILPVDFPGVRALAENRRIEGEEMGVRQPDGRISWVQVAAEPVRAEGLGVVIVCTDISLQRKAAAALQREADALRASEAKLAEALQMAQAAHWHYDVEVDRFTFNEAFYRIFRTSAEAQGGFTMSAATYAERFLDPEDTGLVAGAIREALETGDPGYRRYLEHRFRYADGQEGTMAVRVTIVKGPDGRTRFLDGVNQDTTERKQAERELAIRHRELEELNHSLEVRVQETVAGIRHRDQMLTQQSRQAAMGEMIGNIAHQWRQPLSTLSMLLANLRDQWPAGQDLPGEVDVLLRQGGRLIQGMSQTITDFRDFFRPDKERVAFSLLTQVRAAVTLVEASFRGIGIGLEVESAADVTVLGFPNELAQALLNLLVNARQAYEEQGLTEGSVTASVDAFEDWGRVRVHDNAGGVAAEAMDRLFEPFFTTREGGSGIGLYMTRQIIQDSMGGRIDAKNRAGGAEFTVLVPKWREHG